MSRRDPFGSAYLTGYLAGAGGMPRTHCPYRDRRTHEGKVTYARAWRKAWLSGWDDGKAGKPSRYPEVKR